MAGIRPWGHRPVGLGEHRRGGVGAEYRRSRDRRSCDPLGSHLQSGLEAPACLAADSSTALAGPPGASAPRLLIFTSDLSRA
jgi:hypothetical protein